MPSEPTDERRPEQTRSDPATSGAQRREFIKKLTYVAPVLTTYLLSDDVFGQADGRQRGRTSPHPSGKEKDKQDNPPPPPPPPGG